MTWLGDLSKIATMADRRMRDVRGDATGLSTRVEGAAGESVTISGWARERPAARLIDPAAGDVTAPIDWNAESSLFHVSIEVPSRGWVGVRVTRDPSG